MDSLLRAILGQAEDVKEAVENATDALNGTESAGTRTPSTPEGMAIAYGSLVVMALLPIFFGSYRSASHHKEKRRNKNDKTVYSALRMQPEKMSKKDAMMFPIMASFALFGLYVFFKLFSKEYINMLLTGYFFCLGVCALTHVVSPCISNLVPNVITNIPYRLTFQKDEGEKAVHLVNYKFNTHDVVALICCLGIGAWYLLEKHWIANNLFGLAFALNAVELLHLNNVITGFILLSGLFIYDIFWVFGTDVMVTVAKSFDAPIKLVFPQDLLTDGLKASNFAMLGLGDIVIPGIFIALLLRFDKSLNRKSNLYFNATLIAYLFGLLFTIFIMHVFKHAQPALLYLVPACLGVPTILAFVKGDFTALFKYEDAPEEGKEGQQDKANTNKSASGGQLDDSKSTSYNKLPEMANKKIK